jgi:glyoxylase-like metal-dependent hydrolase (beta-lactamase superfamily II)
VRAVGLHPDVVVVTSAFWQTNATAVRSGSEAFLIDSPVLPDELELLPGMLQQSGFPVVGLLVTHADWDHLLGRYAFPEAAMACGETTAARLAAEPGDAQRELRKFDDENYIERPGPLSIPGAQALPVPGYCEVGERELELHPADGHTADGTAIWDPGTGVLVLGDYVSPVEIPWLSEGGGNLEAYLATLERLRPLVEQAEWIVPGHGSPMASAQALAVLREDVAYLEALRETGEAAELPIARRSQAQRGIHALNVALVSGGAGP